MFYASLGYLFRFEDNLIIRKRLWNDYFFICFSVLKELRHGLYILIFQVRHL